MPGMNVLFKGDMWEGLDPNKFGTNATNALPLTDQHYMFREHVAEPLEGIARAAVTDHSGHEGWALLHNGLYIWTFMYGGLDVQRVQNGGEMNVRYWSGSGRSRRRVAEDKHIVFHNTKVGGADKNPLRPLLNETSRYSRSNAPVGVHGAHIHYSGVGVENKPGTAGRKRDGLVSIAMVQSGAAKGGEGHSDPYGVSEGMGLTNPLGQGLEVMQRREGRGQFVYPTISRKSGEVVHRAMMAYDLVAGKGVLKEVLESVREKAGSPTVRLNTGDSILTIDPHDEKVELPEKSGYAPQYSRIVYDVTSDLPVGWVLASNLRRGSMTADLATHRELRDVLDTNPNLRALFLRQLVDEGVPDDENRGYILNRIIRTFGPVKGKIDALLLDAILRASPWKRTIAGNNEPIAAGTYLSYGLEVPLLDNFGVVEFRVGRGRSRPRYTGMIVDGLSSRGSYAYSTHGPLAVYRDLAVEKPGFLAGGHMPGSGTETIWDVDNPETPEPHLIAPGWMAMRANPSGKRNNMPAAPGWLGVIAMPGNRKDQYQLFPVGNRYQWDLLDGLTVLEAERRGFIDTDKIRRRKRG
jgi:hypothetical protein